jgi:uncharacterized damage-inducible protein DinB
MSARHPTTPLRSHLALLRLNGTLFLNCLDGVSEEHGARRLTDSTNSMAFIASHLVDARCHLAAMLGLELPNPIGERLKDVTDASEVKSLPTLEELRAEWSAASGSLAERMASASWHELAAPAPHEFPVEDPSVLGGVAFLLQHEAFHIGQLAFLRKQLGYPSMAYPQAEG